MIILRHKLLKQHKRHTDSVMATTLVIRKKIDIEGKYLSKDIEKNILHVARKNLVNECDKENGYILSVEKVENIIDFSITNATNKNIATVDLVVQTIKPESGKQLVGQVCMVFPGGLFIKVENRIQILIPEDSLKVNYQLNTEINAFVKKSKSDETTSTTNSASTKSQSLSKKDRKSSSASSSSSADTTTAMNIPLSISDVKEEDIIKENDVVCICITSFTYSQQKKFSSYGELLYKIKM